MNGAPRRLVARLIAIQAAALGAKELLVVLFAPRLLLLDSSVIEGSAQLVVWGWGATVAIVVLATMIVARGFRNLLRELSAGETDVEAAEVHALYAAPARLVWVDLVGTIVLSTVTLFAPIRPETNDLYTQVELALLTVTMASVAALPAYVMMRASTARVLELVPVRVSREAIDAMGTQERRMARVRQRLLAAVWAPVAFVAVGAALLVHAHLRAFDTSSRQNDAAELVQGVFEPVEADGRGRKAAIDAAREQGFAVDLFRSDSLFRFSAPTTGRRRSRSRSPTGTLRRASRPRASAPASGARSVSPWRPSRSPARSAGASARRSRTTWRSPSTSWRRRAWPMCSAAGASWATRASSP